MVSSSRILHITFSVRFKQTQVRLFVCCCLVILGWCESRQLRVGQSWLLYRVRLRILVKTLKSTQLQCRFYRSHSTLTLLRMSSTSFRKISSTLKLSLALASQKRIPLIREANCKTKKCEITQRASREQPHHFTGAEIKLNNKAQTLSTIRNFMLDWSTLSHCF